MGVQMPHRLDRGSLKSTWRPHHLPHPGTWSTLRLQQPSPIVVLERRQSTHLASLLLSQKPSEGDRMMRNTLPGQAHLLSSHTMYSDILSLTLPNLPPWRGMRLLSSEMVEEQKLVKHPYQKPHPLTPETLTGGQDSLSRAGSRGSAH